jgi:hypothetical protein
MLWRHFCQILLRTWKRVLFRTYRSKLTKVLSLRVLSQGEAGAVPEPAQLQLQGQEHQGDAPLQQEISFHLQKGAKKCTIVYSFTR